MTQNTRLTPVKSREKGIFSKDAWIKEARHHQIVARLLRDLAQRRRRSVGKLLKTKGIPPRQKIGRAISEAEASFRGSALHAGYATESFLKAGVVCLYQGCSKELLEKDLKRKFGHKLQSTAKELDFPMEESDVQLLEKLEKYIQNEARYPLSPLTEGDYSKKVNDLTSQVWGTEAHRQRMSLLKRADIWASNLNQMKENPAHTIGFRIDGDGYFVLRLGGGLPTRLTYRFSSDQIANGNADLDSLLELVLQIPKSVNRFLLEKHWNMAEWYEDKRRNR